MLLNELCNKIGLQPEMTSRVLTCQKVISGHPDIQKAMGLLFAPETWNTGLDLLRQELREELGDDSDGAGILTCMLLCGTHTYELYQEKRIDDTVFTATFQCFPRFIEEHKVSYGTYAFDRDWWTSRQISLKLFRLGELEYELPRSEQDEMIHIHIPTHARLTSERLAQSYQLAKDFLQKHYPEFASARMICNSWMLSPALDTLLPENSGLRRFRSAFIIESVNETAEDYKEWVFKNPKLTLENLPEDTSLQRSMKRYLQQGGTIGTGTGWLKGF